MRYSHCGVIVRRSLGKRGGTGVSKTALHPRIPGLQVRNLVHTESTARLFGLLSVRVGVVGNISACHADARGSIPRRGEFFFLDALRVFLGQFLEPVEAASKQYDTLPEWLRGSPAK